MMRFLVALLFLTTTTLVVSAPAPFDRYSRNTTQVTSGIYLWSWNGYPGTKTILYGDGTYRMEFDRDVWRGKWRWDKAARVLIVTRTTDSGKDLYKFVWKVNNSMEGEGVGIASIRITKER